MLVNMTDEQVVWIEEELGCSKRANDYWISNPTTDSGLLPYYKRETDIIGRILTAIQEARAAQQTMAMTLPCKHWAGSDFCEIKPDVCGGHNSNCGSFVREGEQGE